jgi:hypothetical protein
MGRPAEGVVVEGVEVVPNRIEIVGAQSEVQGISQVDTGTVDLTGRTVSFETKAKIEIGQPHAWPSTGQGEVEVRVTLVQKSVQRLLKQISLKVENERGPMRLEPPRVDVILEGPAGRIDALAPEEVGAWVVLPKEGPLPESLPVRVRLPVEGVRARSSPEEVGVKALPPADSP